MARHSEDRTSKKKLKERIRRAIAIRPEYDHDNVAQDLILAFFQATRQVPLRLQSMCTGTDGRSAQALAYGMGGGKHYDLLSIRRISRAVAQIRLSPTIDVVDAVLAIDLNEETRAAKGY